MVITASATVSAFGHFSPHSNAAPRSSAAAELRAYNNNPARRWPLCARCPSPSVRRSSPCSALRYSVRCVASTRTMSSHSEQRAPRPKPLTIGIVGFGNFGQFLGNRFASQGHRVIGQSRGNYFEAAASIGCEYVQRADELMDHEPNVVIFCTSIMSLSTVLSHFPLKRLANTLVVDVLSVKLYPHDLLLSCLPQSADVVCTHPMFGPESGRHSWKGLPFVYDIVRVNPKHQHICDAFVDIWRLEGCTMVRMDCATHDKHAASTQFITHTTGRMLAQLHVESTPINTKGYESLLGVVDTTCKDSFALYYGLYKYNPNAKQELDNLEAALKDIRKMLDLAEENEAQRKKNATAIRLPSPVGRTMALSDEVLRSLMRRAAPRS